MGLAERIIEEEEKLDRELSRDERVELGRARLQHGRITRSAKQIADAHGEIGSPYLAETLLARLERRGDISAIHRAAGEQFQSMFRLAALDPLRAADVARIPVQGAGREHHHGSEFAYRQVHKALKALGGQASPCGSCCWFVIGCEHTLRDWARREGWGGKPIREEVAKGTLIGALGVLAVHFGLERK